VHGLPAREHADVLRVLGASGRRARESDARGTQLHNDQFKGEALELALVERMWRRRGSSMSLPVVSADLVARPSCDLQVNHVVALNAAEWAALDAFEVGTLYKLPAQFPWADFAIVMENADERRSTHLYTLQVPRPCVMRVLMLLRSCRMKRTRTTSGSTDITQGGRRRRCSRRGTRWLHRI
jgi:hypothetical protein